MHQNIATTSQQKRAVLVALVTPQQSLPKTNEYLDEMAFLAFTWGVETIATFTQKLDKPNAETFVGKGKLAEIRAFVHDNQVHYVLLDDELSLAQVRNLETTLACNVLDRSLLILNIFAMRAKTAQAKVQVELAQYQYLLPRLKRMWTHLSRQQGAGTGMRGPGEKELETDRRIIQDKVAFLRKKLQAIERQSTTQRKSRAGLIRVALVGYTNVGKSTLMHKLSKAAMHAEDKLFATIDATVRKVVIKDRPFLLTDTVGFIRKLPHTLIECFKSTLAEIREADILLHVVDISHPTFEEHMQVVTKTLQELGVADLPTIVVLNKMDKLSTAEQNQETTQILAVLQKYSLSPYRHPMVLVAATQERNMAALKELLYQQVVSKHQKSYPNKLEDACFVD